MAGMTSAEASSARPVRTTAGPVMIIGGAEGKRRDRTILTRFVGLAGGADARIAVIATASTFGQRANARYAELFAELGAGHVTGLCPLAREEANDPANSSHVAEATGVFLTGGNQLRLVSVVGGTRLEDALASAHDRGVVVAGTSAGASAVAAHMVAFGRSGASPKHRMIHLSAGLRPVETGRGGRGSAHGRGRAKPRPPRAPLGEAPAPPRPSDPGDAGLPGAELLVVR